MCEKDWLKESECLPNSVWPVDSVRELENQSVKELGISLYHLMQAAGQAAFQLIKQLWPTAQHWLILCGRGNNGGDGFVIARLALLAGYQVTLLSCAEDDQPPEAARARIAWIASGGTVYPANSIWPEQVDIIIDALLGIGMCRSPELTYLQLIQQANSHGAPIFAIDVPSGLMATNGSIPNDAIKANHTITFIGLKPGLLTGNARDYVGKLHYHALGLDKWLSDKNPPMARFDASNIHQWLTPRQKNCHKGDYGRLLVVGGAQGTAGAIRITAEAALRSGAGLVRVLTNKENIAPILAARPELMVDVLTDEHMQECLLWADVIAIGPGMGKQEQSITALQQCEKSGKPMIWDADALNLLAKWETSHANRIITPHAGEAARLLQVDINEIEQDRLYFARELVKRYGGIAVLKGAATVIASSEQIAFADVGNAGMASGGMGDALTGIIAALLAQHLNLYSAACAGCVIHGAAGDQVAALYGQRGMLATDLIAQLWQFVNPEDNHWLK